MMSSWILKDSRNKKERYININIIRKNLYSKLKFKDWNGGCQEENGIIRKKKINKNKIIALKEIIVLTKFSKINRSR